MRIRSVDVTDEPAASRARWRRERRGGDQLHHARSRRALSSRKKARQAHDKRTHPGRRQMAAVRGGGMDLGRGKEQIGWAAVST